VLRAEVDVASYDLVLEAARQDPPFNSRRVARVAVTSKQTINTELADREGGCVV